MFGNSRENIFSYLFTAVILNEKGIQIIFAGFVLRFYLKAKTGADIFLKTVYDNRIQRMYLKDIL